MTNRRNFLKGLSALTMGGIASQSLLSCSSPASNKAAETAETAEAAPATKKKIETLGGNGVQRIGNFRLPRCDGQIR